MTMTHKNAPTARILVVRHDRRVSGVVTTVHTIDTGHVLPWRIARRRTLAHRIGLAHVRTLPGRFDADDRLSYVAVTDGRNVLARWRTMPELSGWTGTHDRHPLIDGA